MKTPAKKGAHKFPKVPHGFTLVELMVVVALSTMVFYGIFTMLRLGAIQANVAGVRMTIGSSAREGMTRMLQELREASPDSFVWATSTISFTIPQSVSDGGSITWGPAITYSLGGTNNTQLLRTQSGQISVVANDIQAVNFSSNDVTDPSLVTVQMTVQRQTLQGRTYSETLVGQGKVRNE